jgi:hypothetical protein
MASSIRKLWPRSSLSIADVGWLPQRGQMTLGGDPDTAAISAKSESRDESVKPLVLAYFPTTRSPTLSNSTSRTRLESANKSANERQSLKLIF